MINNSFILVFILAHLIGDFVFQTNKIAKLKAEGVKGLLIHCSIVSAVQVVALSFYGINGIFAAIAVGIIHFFIDLSKNHINRFIHGFNTLLFLVDQGVHIIVIYLFSLLFSTDSGRFDEFILQIRIVIAIILAAYFSTVLVKIALREMFLEIRKEAFFLHFERPVDAITSIFIFICFMLPVGSALIIFIPLAGLYQRFQRKLGVSNSIASMIKYVIIVILGLIISLLSGTFQMLSAF